VATGRGATNAASSLPRTPQEGDIGKEAGRSPSLGWRSGLSQEIQDAVRIAAVAGSSKRLASRFYQMKTGHCLTGQYLNWRKSRPSAQCWWCPYRIQTREHVFKFKNCPEWKAQRKTLWVEVRKETGRGKDRFKIRDILADTR
jgi:hypothetical protein